MSELLILTHIPTTITTIILMKAVMPAAPWLPAPTAGTRYSQHMTPARTADTISGDEKTFKECDSSVTLRVL